ncbi:MAG: sulfatase-like hydrolase/transferase [Planctomycetota bacterium]
MNHTFRPVLLVVSLQLSACGAKPTSPPDVLLITLDTTRQDRLGCYGRKQARTPNIDRLAAQGARFANCYTCAPLTFPAHATMLTGVYPFVHQGHDNALFKLPPQVPTIATFLKRAGYRTGAFVSAVVLDGKFELNRDFDEYDDHVVNSINRLAGMAERPGNLTTDAALAWLLKLAPADHFFTWLHLFDPHRPWEAPAPFKDENPDPYDAEIAFADAQVGRVLAALKQNGRNDVLVIVVADHGEGMGEHGETTHGMLIHDATTRVPLIIADPSLAAGTVVPGFARTVDLAPTILERVGVAIPAAMQGVSLWPRLRGASKDEADDPPAYLETYHPHYNMGWSYLEGLVKSKYKLVDAPETELYDLHADPGELTNRAREEPAVTSALGAELEQLRSTGPQITAPAASLPPAAAAQMKALGYGASVNHPIDRQDRGMNPREHLAALDQREAARELAATAAVGLRIADGLRQQLALGGARIPDAERQQMQDEIKRQLTEAVRLLTQATAQFTEYEKYCRLKAQALEMLGGAYAQLAEASRGLQDEAAMKRHAEHAVELLEKALAELPDLLDSRINLATCYYYLGQVDKYELSLLRAIETYARDPRPHYFLGVLYSRNGELETADLGKRRLLLEKGLHELELALDCSRGVPEQERQMQSLIGLVRGLLEKLGK